MISAEKFAAVGSGLTDYHTMTGTSLNFRMSVRDDSTVFLVHIASVENHSFEFTDEDILIAWLTDLNLDISPLGSAMTRQRAEAIKKEQILREAEAQAIQQEIDELPETQSILDATAAAQKIIEEAEARLENLEAAKNAAEAEAEAITAAVAEAEEGSGEGL